MSFTVREPGRADAGALAALHVSTWQETYSRLLPEGFFTDAFADGRRRMWEYLLAQPRPEHAVRVAELDGALIGFAWIGPGRGEPDEAPPREHELCAIYVAAAHHGSGVGQELLDAALGALPASLWVATQNPRAIAFYRRNGFAFDGVEKTDPAIPGITEARMLR
ncbi:GNAT family N-acetyltransferase [Microbacterium sp. zg.Y909]|uniref:GNAT family N-acetyltransferase n=1 Tax=Microbacterium sp. zg.Y909 TaxID=2969413 RepID=UPI00214C016F|nr:GNAT family N-acetyltransferase [Microbacterium sp. zg.Y909]MCR2827311.1 GNAT family N-acetyltransferase [Microbacterium sp. zg.Y909]